jgi:glycosyltransferase involved in cell wall biosynthesis
MAKEFVAGDPLGPAGPVRVSVCVASYNGERYIEEQLRTILAQLSAADELIVCDDCSRDRTCDIVRAIGDARVRLHTFDANVGHVRNFERAIAASRGEIILLADQDDAWEPDKLERILGVFDAQPDVLMIHHAMTTMDGEGRSLQAIWNPQREGRPRRLPFVLRQWVKCRVSGCALAFRRSLLDIVMPFPSGVYAHDHWFAIAGAIRAPLYLMAQPLVRYRLHGGNATPFQGLPWGRRIVLRMLYLRMVAIALARRMARAAA